MIEPNNSAERFLQLIRIGKQQKPVGTAATALSAMLGVEPGDTSLLMTRVGKFMALPGQVQEDIRLLDNIDHELHLKWMTQVNNSFNKLNFAAQWKDFINHYNDTVIYGLEICADILRRRSGEKVADKEQIGQLLEIVRDALSELEKSNLDPELTSFIYEHLSQVRNALEEYAITGAKPFEAEVERVLGAIARRPKVWTETHSTSIGEKFWTILGRLAVIATVASPCLQIGDQVINPLSNDSMVVAESHDGGDTIILIENNCASDVSRNGDVASPEAQISPTPPESHEA